MTLVPANELPEVSLTDNTPAPATEVKVWETEADWLPAPERVHTVADGIGGHPGPDTAASGFETGDLFDGLVGYYPLDGDANDALDYGANGSVNGATFQTTGTVGGDSLGFDGTDDNCQFTGGWPELESTSTYTLSMFYRVDQFPSGNNPALIAWGDGWTDNMLFTFLSESDTTFRHRIADGTVGEVKWDWSNITAGTWYHHAVTFDSGDIVMYNDAVEVASDTGGPSTTPTVSADAYFGERSWGNDNAEVTLDDVRLYNRVLTTAEIEALASRTDTQPVPTDWRLSG